MYDTQWQTGITAGLAIILLASLAAPLKAEPNQLSETYRDWIVTCSTAAPGPQGDGPQRICEMSQELFQQQTGQRVLSISLRSTQSGNDARTAFVVPFGLDVRDDIRISIGEHMLSEIAFETCLPLGCIAGGQIGEPEIEILRSEESAIISLPMLSDGTLDVTFSLIGFSAAWGRLGVLGSTSD